MLKVDGLSVAIGSVGILRDVSLRIASGEFAGLIGRNGAGKTTLMRTIMGLLPFRDGAIDFDGVALGRVPTHRRVSLGIGYMPEDRRLVPGLSVEENVLLPAWSARLPDAAEFALVTADVQDGRSANDAPTSPRISVRCARRAVDDRAV